MNRYIIHVVIEGGTVAEDVYVGAFRDYERALDVADRIERAAEREDAGVTCLVRELMPGSSSARGVLEEAGLS